MEAIPELRREFEAGRASPDNHDVVIGMVARAGRRSPAIDGEVTHCRIRSSVR